MSETKVVICPYCGETQPTGERCRVCVGQFEPLSRQATHNEMGPWFIRDRNRPFQPGCSYETLVRLVERGQITKYSVIRGPTSKQFWTVARHVPGVSHLLGFCHACDAGVLPEDHGCPHCGVPFGAYLDRNHLGLPEVRPLPGDAPTDASDDASDGPPGGANVAAWTPAPMTPRGLSSFAPDDELLDGHDGYGGSSTSVAAASTTGSATVSTSVGAATAFRGEAHPVASTSAGNQPAEEWGASPAMRSMQRRLARQQRTIRVLTAIVLIVTVAGALFSVIAISTMRGSDEPSDTSAATDSNDERVEAPIVTPSTP